MAHTLISKESKLQVARFSLPGRLAARPGVTSARSWLDRRNGQLTVTYSGPDRCRSTKPPITEFVDEPDFRQRDKGG